MSTRLGNCEICHNHPAKYTCPACNITSCSVDCVKKHKIDNDCDGLRPRSTFKKLSKLTDFDIQQDYKLLEEVNRTVQISQQETHKTSTKTLNFVPRRYFQLKTHLLRAGTRLLLLPDSFERHKNNKSYVNIKTNIVTWTLQLTFLNAERLRIMIDKWPDNVPLLSLIEKYIEATDSEISPSAFRRLRCYREAGINLIHVLLKADKVPEAHKTFYKLDMDKSLSENLIGKSIVEFPQLYIVIRDFYRAKTVPTRRKQKLSEEFKNKSLLLSTTGEITSKLIENDDDSESDDEVVEMKEEESLPAASSYKDLISK